MKQHEMRSTSMEEKVELNINTMNEVAQNFDSLQSEKEVHTNLEPCNRLALCNGRCGNSSRALR